MCLQSVVAKDVFDCREVMILSLVTDSRLVSAVCRLQCCVAAVV